MKPPTSATPDQRALIEACLNENVSFFWLGPGTLLIESSGLGSVLDVVTAAGANVLGFDGFEMASTEIRPRFDLIYDAESRPDIVNPMAVAADWPKDVWVDVVLDL
jgi:hypothetical protein